jgi:hypothetical protein
MPTGYGAVQGIATQIHADCHKRKEVDDDERNRGIDDPLGAFRVTDNFETGLHVLAAHPEIHEVLGFLVKVRREYRRNSEHADSEVSAAGQRTGFEVSGPERPAGEFEIAGAGTRKDGEVGYFYRDARAEFFFLVELRTAATPLL